MNKLYLAGICLFLSLISSTAKADVLIDSFEDRPNGQFPLLGAYGFGFITPVEGLPHVVGGRGMQLMGTTPEITFPQPTPEVGVDITNSGGQSYLEYTTQLDGASGDFMLDYGGYPGSIGSPQPLGLGISSSSDLLRLTLSSYNHAGAQDMTINFYKSQVWYGNPNAPDCTMTLTSAGAQSVDIPLTGMIGSTLDYMTIEFVAPEGTAFKLDSVKFVSGVPEPGTISLLGPIVLLIMRRSRRAISGRREMGCSATVAV